MPFTPSHIAAVLPFDQSKKLSITALVIGSMAPDFEFFFQMREVENIGHHWYGIFLFDLPITLLLSFVYHIYLKKSFVVNLPDYFRKRCTRTGFRLDCRYEFKTILDDRVCIDWHCYSFFLGWLHASRRHFCAIHPFLSR